MEAAGTRHVWYHSKTDWFRVWNLSDLHVGARGCAEEKLRRDIQTIKDDPFSFWQGGGDYGEFIGHSDKRFNPDAVAEWVKVSDLGDIGKKTMVRVRDLLRPIKHKCFGLLIGNHEKKYELHTTQESLHSWLCEELEVPYLGYSCFYKIDFCRVSGIQEPRLASGVPPRRGKTRHCDTTTIRVFSHHGAGYATTPGGKLNRLRQAMDTFDADLYFLGHVHDQVARREPALTSNEGCTQITERVRLGMISGSYLRTYTQGTVGYGEQAMYRPTTLGAAVARIHASTGKMEAVI